MKRLHSTIPFHKKNRRPIAAFLFCILLLSYQSPTSSSPPIPLPPSLQEQLRQYREKDQLAEWIYARIQWVAKAPSTRSALLTQTMQSAWRRPRSNEEIQAWQDLLSNEGYALLAGGDIVGSTDAYTAAFQWARDHRDMADEALVLENILKPLGNNYTRLGDYEQALFIHRKALSIAVDLEDKNALAGTYSNLANTCSNMGLPEQSLEYCRMGLAVVNSGSALSGVLLSEQADARAQLQRTGEARESIRKSIAILEQAFAQKADPATGYWLQTAYQQAGDLYTATQTSFPIALKYYTKALALQNDLLQRQGTIRRRERAKLFQRLGNLAFRSGQTAQAVHWLDQCLAEWVPGKKIDSLREADLYAENTLVDLLSVRAAICRQQKKTDKALRLYTLCFDTEKKLREELITGSSKERSVTDSRLRTEEAIGTAWEAWESTHANKYRQAMLSFMESSKSRLLLEELQQQARLVTHPGDSLGNRIQLLEKARVYYQLEAIQYGKNDSLAAANAAQEKQITWDLAQLRKKDPRLSGGSFSPDRLQALLGEGQIVRSFFAGSKALYSVECSRGGIQFAEKLSLDDQWQDSLRAFIHTYFGQGANAMIDHPAAYYQQAHTIYRQLFGTHPFQKGKETILLTDQALSLLPVEALVTEASGPPSPEKWSFVIQQTQLSYAWSLQTLEAQSGEGGSRGSGSKDGRSSFSGFFLSGNHPGNLSGSPLLKAIGQEKAGIQRLIRGGNWYSDEQASSAAFRKALESSAIVHISSHAFTKKDSFDAPHIELFDLPFYLFELKSMEHHPALVVLSACRTGDGRMVTGEGVQSLARAFTAGGTNAVVAGWWNVNDEAAAQLMQQFYSALLSGKDHSGAGVNAAGALRKAKLDWIDNPAVSYLHKLPYYWAALQYQGNPTPLPDDFRRGDEPAARPFRSWWWLLLLLAFAGGWVLWLRRKH